MGDAEEGIKVAGACKKVGWDFEKVGKIKSEVSPELVFDASPLRESKHQKKKNPP